MIHKRLREHLGIAIVGTLFCLLSVGYSVLVPLFEVADELPHAEYALYVATFQRLPPVPSLVLEAHQPPLYYLLLTPVLTLLGYDEPIDFYLNPDPMALPLNPAGRLLDGGQDPRMFIHTDAEAFPYQGYALAIHLLRLVSALFGVGTVLSTYALSLILFPGDRTRAVFAAGFVAFVPYFGQISGAITNDTLANLLGALIILQLTRLLIFSEWRWQGWLWLGALGGFAILTKQTVLTLMPFVAVALFARAGNARALLQGFLATTTGAAFVSGWYVLRNLARYGEPLPLAVQQAHLAQFRQVVPPDRFTFDYAQQFVTMARDSFWGRFDAYHLPLPRLAYWFYDVLTLAALVGLVFFLWRSAAFRKWSRPRQFAFGVLVLLVPMQLASMVYADEGQTARQGRFLYVMLPAIGILFATGLMALVPRRARVFASGITLSCLFAVASWVLVAFVAPLYASPQGPPPEAVPLRINDARVLPASSIVLHGQSFRSTRDGLRHIDVRLATYHGRATAPITLRLRVQAESGPDLVAVTIDPQQVIDNDFARFAFEPLADSAGRTYYFVLEASHPTTEVAPAVYAMHQGPPEAIQRYVSGKVAIGSIQFRLGYD